MRLIVRVYDAFGNMLGIVPEVKSASITRLLDGAGSLSIEAFATDERALSLLDNERRVRMYVEEADGPSFGLREIARGIIRNVKIGIGSAGFTLALDGVDELDELKRINTLFNRSYEDAQVADVVENLAGLAGWGVETELEVGQQYVDARFDGSSVLKAIQTLAETQDFHLRLGEAPAVVEIGKFGQVIPLRLINVEHLMSEAYQNKDIAFIESMSITEDTEAVANRIYVLGAGQNVDAALTLEHSTRTNPYDIRWLYGPDGRKMWYIEDEDSVARYGLIERIVTFKEIAPLANNDDAIHRAANMLYDAAKAWLRKNAFQVLSFNMSLKKCEQTVRPGDIVRVVYRGVIEKDGMPYTWKSFDALMWVIKVTESVGTEGKSTRLEVCNLDQHRWNAAKIVVGAMEQITVQGIKAQPSFNLATYGPYRKEIDPDHSVTVPLKITDAMYQLVLCRLTIKTTPFRATAAGTAAAEIPVVTSSNSGQHNHAILFDQGTTLATGLTARQYAVPDGGIGFINFNLATNAAGSMYTATETTGHTHDVTIPAHNHELDYGIYDDTLYPGKMKITVNGQVIGENLGSSTEAYEGEFDITEIINATTLRSTHPIVITCAEEGSQGIVEVEVELYSMILPIKLG